MTKSATKYQKSQQLQRKLETFVTPLLVALDRQLDKRLVRTFLLTLQAIINFRHSSYGLLLSELGGYITSPAHAPAGTKRLSNLLRSKRWSYGIIADYLWRKADQEVSTLLRDDKTALVIWDESIWENQRVCTVRDCVQCAPAKPSGSNASNPVITIHPVVVPSLCRV